MISSIAVMYAALVGCLFVVVSGDLTQLAHQPERNETAVVVMSFPDSTVYSVTEKPLNIADPFLWIEVHVGVIDPVEHDALVQAQVPSPGQINTTFFVPQPVYVSLTTMASRMHKVNRTIINLINARIIPTKIYLFISKEPYLLDTGVQQIPDALLCLVAQGYLQIIFTENLGPHRKLLPALRRHWGQDVFIATVDDDMHRDQGYIILYQLMKHYVLGGSGDRIVALRTRRIGFCRELPYKITRYYSWPVQLTYNRQEMLIMPTGTGGILYKPSYFHKVIFHKALRYATGTADDLMFRLATLANSIPVELGCSVMRYRARVVRKCDEDELDRKYDRTYGPESTEYFKKLIAETTARMEADIAALEAPTEPENEHDNSGVVDAQKDHPNATAHAEEQQRHHHHQRLRQRRLRQANSHPADAEEEWEEQSNSAGMGWEEDRDEENEENGKVAWRARGVFDHHENLPCAMDERDASDTDPCDGDGDGESESEGENEDSEDRESAVFARRLRSKRIKYRGVIRNGTETDLFSINRRGGNDVSWKIAVEVLRSMKVMDIEKIVTEFINERDSFCYARKGRTVRMERFCAIFQCGKPQNITMGNTTITHTFHAIP
jgi:hypothetical protein